ncbi:MAG: L,D-transpeptidase family protein [Bacteroidota bacterium]
MKHISVKILYFIALIGLCFSFTFIDLPDNFMSRQLKFDRVKEAFAHKEKTVRSLLAKQDIDLSTLRVILVAYKEESEIELWTASDDNDYHLLKTYSICSRSGVVGPKRKAGDLQVPEGLYKIDRFNPVSSYHLSLGLNYPNTSDKILGSKDPGSNIFIHGECVTIGCMPVTNDKIEEVYLFAALAKDAGQQEIPVYVFPLHMDIKGMNRLKPLISSNPTLGKFWYNLKTCHDRFQSTHRPVPYSVDTKGNYVLN